MLRRAAIPTTTLWQRRPTSEGMLSLHAGVGDTPWKPELGTSGSSRLEDAVREAADDNKIPSAPVEVDLSGGGVVGITGDRAGALALARSLIIQATTHVGPADLTVGVFCDPGRESAWDWATWLPHTRTLGSNDRWLSADRSRSLSLLRSMRDSIETLPTRAVLLLIDSDVLLEGREAPARVLLGHGRTGDPARNPVQVSGIVIATSPDQLPASCTVTIDVGEDAEATLDRPADLTRIDQFTLAGISPGTAADAARDLARFDDPELVIPGAALPNLVRLPPLLGVEQVDASAIAQLWGSSTGFFTPLGAGEKGTFGIDLVRDGPHGLVGGTTGSGKSEFLRSLVAGLAARNDPTRLTFILIDFKGGAAFKACERLPHTIGTVSNLDEQLADRALRALEAEMDYRQRRFAEAGEGIDNLDAYLATNPPEPMPRLLLVVDEFAMLAKDFPDVLSSLVAVGAVGRTLGVHMILATQRPAGVVNDDILANTNLRVALRVQSRDDSINVIGVPSASAIGRNQRGRAFVKLGQDEIVPIQTALVTGRAEAPGRDSLDVVPVMFGAPAPASAVETVDETDLDLLIGAIVEANQQAGFDSPRPVWPEPLGDRIDLTGFPSLTSLPSIGGYVEGELLTVGVSDDPDRQRQIPASWLLDQGNLLLLGIPGSGTSTALATIALVAARDSRPDDLDLIVLDLGSRDLAALADLPHTLAYVGSGSAAREQQVRLLKHVHAEFDRRRAAGGRHRPTIVLIDGLATLREEYQDFEGMQLLEGLYRAWADGPDVNLWFAASTTRAKSVPSAIDDVTTQKWMFRLADPYDYSAAGIRSAKDLPAAVPGRCVLATNRLQTHIATAGVPLPDAVATIAVDHPQSQAKVSVVRQLPDRVAAEELGGLADLAGEPWRIPVGISESDLEPFGLELYEGEHALIAGPPRSGKSTLLLGIAKLLLRSPDAVTVWAISNRRSPLFEAQASLLDRTVGSEDIGSLISSARLHKGRLVILVDDAEKVDDSAQAIAGLLDACPPQVHVIAAGRADDLRSLYSHWTKSVRKSRVGVLLQPNPDYDGDLLGVSIPRRAPVALTPGRGYACLAGTPHLVQTVR